MSTYKLGPGDVSTLNEAADLAVDAAKAAKREAKKAFLGRAVHEADQLEGYAEEAKTFLKNIERGQAELSKGHVEALATGVRILYGQVRKLRERELEFMVNTEGSEQRSAEIRDTFRKLRVDVQLEIEDEIEAAHADGGERQVSQETAQEPAREPKRHARGRAAASPTVEA